MSGATKKKTKRPTTTYEQRHYVPPIPVSDEPLGVWGRLAATGVVTFLLGIVTGFITTAFDPIHRGRFENIAEYGDALTAGGGRAVIAIASIVLGVAGIVFIALGLWKSPRQRSTRHDAEREAGGSG